MRFDEISKAEFVDKLKDPALSELVEIFKIIRKALPAWQVSLDRGDKRLTSAKIHLYNPLIFDLTGNVDTDVDVRDKMERFVERTIKRSTHWRFSDNNSWNVNKPDTTYLLVHKGIV